MLWPGYLSGALIVFIFGFTDLGTPLIFAYERVAAVRIFDARVDTTNPNGYVLAVVAHRFSGRDFLDFAARTG